MNVDEVDVAQLAEGQAAHLSFDALPDEEVAGTVTYIAPSSTNIGGAVAYGVVAPFVAMTRPSEIGKPLEPLLFRPARYTFVDPLGEH